MTADSSATRWRATVLALWAAGAVVVMVMHVVWPQPGHPEAYWPWPLGFVLFPVTGALILIKRPGNEVGRVLMLTGTAAAVIFFAWWLAFQVTNQVVAGIADAVSGSAVVPSFLGIVVLLHIFPTGQPIGPRHRWVIHAIWGFAVVMFLVSLLLPGELLLTQIENPIGVLPEWAPSVFAAGGVVALILAIFGIGVLAYRRRHGDMIERLQLRWFLSGAAVGLSIFFLTFFEASINEVLGIRPGSVGDNLVGVSLVVAFWAVPIGITVAILRYRLFDIDRLISRTLAYVVVLVLLGGVFALGVVGIQIVLPASSSLAVAASTLAVAAMFNPLLRRTKHLVDRRFNRSRVDNEKVTATIAESLRMPASNPHDVAGKVADVVSRALEPSSIGMWVRE
jgi:hypothetical protein